jgi:uncharacterized protein
MEILQRRS